MSRRDGVSEDRASSAIARALRLGAAGLMLVALPDVTTLALTPTLNPTPTVTAIADSCIGDCDMNGEVTVSELLTMVSMAFGNAGSCAAGDADGNEVIEITEIVAAVHRALSGCGGAVPTPTPEPFVDGACYESADCLPTDSYPGRPFAAAREYCCQLSRTSGDVPFSWCPADMFDAASAVCSQCVFPCEAAAEPTPTPEPLEGGACYESNDCFPSEDYPFRPYLTDRTFCCYLARHGGTFSWCPADMYDSSSLSCAQCSYPCK
jgi:hypothetical protein